MSTQNHKIIRDLGNGLILRHALPQDGEALAVFFGEHLAGDLASRDGQGLAAMIRDIFSLRPHVSLTPNDFTIIEETASGRIISSMCLIQQTWTYGGIEFGFGRPEYVATHPDFRKRGLVRAQFDVVHQWSAERGLMVQGITGIPYFYRQFGYEFALDLGGRRFGFVPPKLKEGESEKFEVRTAEEKDIPFLMSTYEHRSRRSVLGTKWTHEHWHNNLYEMSVENIQRLEFKVIERTETHESVGYLAHPASLAMSGAYVFHFELKPEVSWLEVSPFVARYLWNLGQEYAKAENKTCESFGFYLGGSHPAYEALGNTLPAFREPYAWYLRVPDLVGFLNHIKSALEKRLTESIACGHSREIKVSFYRDGLRIVIEQGKLTTIEKWMPSPKEGGDIAFPDRTFLQMLFGYRNYDELDTSFADCWCDHEEVRILMDILFPKKLSDVYPVA